MENTSTINRTYETAAWGAIFVWWGITEMIANLPDGIGAIGVGVILLGLNIARWQKGIPASKFSTTLGILALLLGGLELAGAFLSLPFELPIFAILLLVLGVIILVNAFK